MLNKDQKRGLTIALRIVEENMQYVEQVFNNGTYNGILYDMKCNMAEGVKWENYNGCCNSSDHYLELSGG